MAPLLKKRRAPLRRRLDCRRGSVRQIAVLLILPLLFTAFAAALYWGWQVVWQTAPWSPHFSLQPANIEIVNQSPWVDRQAILQQVVHEASLDDQLSLLDSGLNERLRLAIEDHPWVERVERIEKFQPPRVLVTLQYREPVAFVQGEATSSVTEGESSRLCLIDRDGVRLPLEDQQLFAQAVQVLAQVSGVPFRPPPPGEVWQDGRILGAARIAGAFGKDWHPFALQAIRTSPQPVVGSSDSYIFELVTRAGKTIRWGPEFVGADTEQIGVGEPTAVEKAARLKAYVVGHGIDLDGYRLNTPQRTEPDRSSTE